MKFTPRKHQTDAINAIVAELAISNRTTTVMACGSGKTLVALWVAEKMDAKNILVLLPSLALVAQVFSEWKKHSRWTDFNVLCICSDKTVTENDDIKVNPDELEFPVTTDSKVVKKFLNSLRDRKIVFSTYQSCDLIPNDFKFDLGIFDEAHKTAGYETKQFSYALSDENVNITKRLFMTATPKHFDVNKRNKLGENLAIFSMDNQAIYGRVCHTLSFSDAVKQDIICGYKIIISTLTLAEVNRALINSSNVNIKNKLIEAKNIASSLALVNAINNNDIKKVFTFHRTIKDAKTFTSKSNRVLDRGLKKHLALHISGDMNSNERGAIIDNFEQSPLAILSNAKCLTEGVDVPAVDMVAFMSPKKSQIDIIQATGRAMRKYGNKQQGYVLIPIFLEKEENFEEALNETQYNHIWNILQALQEYDEELSNIISDLQRSSVRKEKINYEQFNKKIEVMGVSSELRLTTLRNAVTTKIVDKLTNTWDENFEKLLIFKEKHGHTTISREKHSEHEILGNWVNAQRMAFKEIALSQNQIDKLNSIQFSWQKLEDNWNVNFESLLAYKEKYGHPNIPQKRHQDKRTPLMSWICRQRQLFKDNNLSQERINLLESIGFSWNIREILWDENFEKLLRFKEKHGHANISQANKKNRSLGMWSTKQRKCFKDDTLSQDRIDKLNSIQFVSKLREAIRKDFWDENFEKLINFKEK